MSWYYYAGIVITLLFAMVGFVVCWALVVDWLRPMIWLKVIVGVALSTLAAVLATLRIRAFKWWRKP